MVKWKSEIVKKTEKGEITKKVELTLSIPPILRFLPLLVGPSTQWIIDMILKGVG